MGISASYDAQHNEFCAYVLPEADTPYGEARAQLMQGLIDRELKIDPGKYNGYKLWDEGDFDNMISRDLDGDLNAVTSGVGAL